MTGTRPRRRFWGIVWMLAVAGVLSSVVAAPKYKTEVLTVGGNQPVGPGSPQNPDPGAPGGPVTQPGVNPANPGKKYLCAPGGNGGATETGVTGRSIKLGATVVETGIGASFLKDVRYGMFAVVNKVNAGGGICGRRLDLVLKDDAWRADLGATYIQNLVEQDKVFALAVVPSSEGLRSATQFLTSKGVPVVGTDGMLAGQYTAPVIWPVAAATITAVHVMVKHAYDKGARSFGIVYDSNYHFGIEGAYAYNQVVKRLTGKQIAGYADPLSGSAQCRQHFCGIKAGQPSYATEIEVFNSSCVRSDKPCDFILYLLEPDTALKWMLGGGATAKDARFGVGGPQPLFNRSFGANCGIKCHNMMVWTGYKPPIEPFDTDPAVRRYVTDLKETSAGADVSNSFVQGGYIGMKLLVEALEKLGPFVTRQGLMAVLDTMRFDAGLSTPLAWQQGKHFANKCMLAFSIQSEPSFAGWRHEADWTCDPWSGLDLPPTL